MAIANNNIIQVTVVQTYLSQVMNNIFYYRIEDLTGTPTYDELSDAFALDVLNSMNGIQLVDVVNVRLILKNLTNGLDIYEVPNTATGDRTGSQTPSFTAWGFRLVRSTALTRHGSKRVGGVDEADITGNNPVSGILSALSEFAGFCASPLTVDGAAGDCTMLPVIVGRFPTGDPNAGELDLSKINPISDAQFIRVTTQTTRKAGRGV